mmetsp:Transcript_19811/g.27664  ORF Transcript_19811/g.27664 Transcript_19811/m.27664 type:complete len:448 (+) Transcript_19811:109-1452(+)
MKTVKHKTTAFRLTTSLDTCFSTAHKKWISTNVVPKPELSIQNPKTFSLRVCARSGDFARAFEVIDQLKERGINPGLKSYNNVITACIKGKRLDKAFEVLSLIKKANLLPTTVEYTNLIHGCVAVQDYARAWKVFDFLRKKNLMEPDQVTYTTMIHACAKTKETEKALNLFEEMQHRGLVPTEVTFNTLIYACAQREDFYDDAKKIIHQMKEYGFVPDLVTMNTLLNAAEVNGDLETATSLISLMESSDTFQPDIVSYTSLLNTVARACRHPAFRLQLSELIKKAQEIFSLLSTKNLTPTQKTLNSYLSVYATAMTVNRAEEVWKTIFSEHNTEPDEHSYNIMINMYCRSKKLPQALELFFEMKKKGMQPNERTFKNLLAPCATTQFVDAGMKIVTLMINHGFMPDSHLLGPLISEYNRQGMYQESDKLKRMTRLQHQKKRFVQEAK